TVEHGGVDAVLVAQVRDGDVFEEVEPKDGDLLLGGESLAGLLGHGRTSARDRSLFERSVFPIPSDAKHPRLPGPPGYRQEVVKKLRGKSWLCGTGSWCSDSRARSRHGPPSGRTPDEG